MSISQCGYWRLWGTRLPALLAAAAVGTLLGFVLAVWCSYKLSTDVIRPPPNLNNSPCIPARRMYKNLFTVGTTVNLPLALQ